MPDAETVRCFIAIELPPEAKRALARLQDSLKQGVGPGVRWADPEGVHLTLKFLGQVDARRLPEIAEAMARSARGFTPFSLELAGTGVFPNPSRPRVAWVGFRGDTERLVRLQKEIESSLVPLGFPREARGFTPHLTLARLRQGTPPREQERFGRQVVAAIFGGEGGGEGGGGGGGDGPVPMDVQQVSLIKSQLTPKGSIYTRLAHVPLGDALPRPRR
ncbi:MAG: RNA 2',3'-cyclic phosphodiesterase [Dehalococcoidia bacterium]